MCKSTRSLKWFLSIAVISVSLVGGVWLNGQQAPAPLLDQAELDELVATCMTPVWQKLLQPPPGQTRDMFCIAFALGVGNFLAGDVRDIQTMNQMVVNQIQIMADITQIQADLGAMQAQLISNAARITTLESAPINFQTQIDAINTKLAGVATALQ